jgi:gluconate 5-dehydrogenase
MGVSLFDLTGKIALVTGSTHGLGMAMAKGLGHAGATIIVNGNSSQTKIDEAVQEFQKEGIHAFGYKFNVAVESEVITAISKIESEVGAIDILINNAGIIKRIPLIEMEVSEFKEVVDIDLVSPFIVSKHVAKGMIARQNGKIINICSMMSELGRNSVGAYAAAKGGLKMLTKNMATEWGKHNVQVNGIGPGYFATEQTAPIRID